nr:TonB-dependent receptor [Sphingomonas sp. Y57]
MKRTAIIRFKATLTTASALAALTLAMPVAAQTATGAAPQPADAEGGLSEIVVTAQKRAENLQSIPFSVSAVSSDFIERNHIVDIRDLTGQIPNVQFQPITNQSLTAALTIRGIGIPTNPDPYTGTEVAIVTDGVVAGTRLTGLVDQFDVERIEVLRGPQGTLFGANTTGGVINIVTKQPTGEFGVEGRLTLANYHEFDAAAAVNFPLTETLAGKVTVSHRSRDGFYTNLANGRDLGGINTSNFRGYLKWDAADNIDTTVIASYDRVRNDSDAIPNISGPDRLFYQAPGFKKVDFKVYSDATGVNDANIYSITQTTNIDSGTLGRITAITNYSDMNAFNIQDVDGLPAFLLNAGRDLKAWQFSQELRTSFKIGDSIESTIGAFYLDVESKVDTLTMPNGVAPGIETEQFVKHRARSLSGFAQFYWDITDRLRIGAGGRLTWEKIKLFESNDTYSNPNLRPDDPVGNIASGTFVTGFSSSGSDTWTNVGGKLSIDYKVTPGTMLYGYYARGFKSGGFNGRVTDPRDIGPYDPEFVDTFEAGFKSDLFDRRLRFNLALFLNKWRDMQVGQSVYRGAVASSVILNAGRAVTKGFEAEMQAAPVDDLRISASVGYLDAHYKEFSDNATGIDYAGVPLPYAPKWSGAAGIDYTIHTAGGKIVSQAQYTYQGTRWGNYTQHPTERLRPLSLVNANISYSPESDRWSVTLWSRNLFNKKYIASALDVPPLFSFASYGAPRQYGVDFGFKF